MNNLPPSIDSPSPECQIDPLFFTKSAPSSVGVTNDFSASDSNFLPPVKLRVLGGGMKAPVHTIDAMGTGLGAVDDAAAGKSQSQKLWSLQSIYERDSARCNSRWRMVRFKIDKDERFDLQKVPPDPWLRSVGTKLASPSATCSVGRQDDGAEEVGDVEDEGTCVERALAMNVAAGVLLLVLVGLNNLFSVAADFCNNIKQGVTDCWVVSSVDYILVPYNSTAPDKRDNTPFKRISPNNITAGDGVADGSRLIVVRVRELVLETMKLAARTAPRQFATGVHSGAISPKMHSLVQCMPDMTADDCLVCLQRLLDMLRCLPVLQPGSRPAYFANIRQHGFQKATLQLWLQGGPFLQCSLPAVTALQHHLRLISTQAQAPADRAPPMP